MEKAAIVILNYNGWHYLEKFLPAVLTHSGDIPVYVADNHSTDDSLARLQAGFPAVRVIPLDRNYGFAGGYNHALSRIESDYYILLNSDVEVTPGWTEPVLRLMEEHHDIAACQPKIIDYRRPGYFEYAGAGGGWIDRFGYPFCRGRIFQNIEKDFGQYDDIAPVFWASGACLFIRSNVFHDLGGFDEDFFAHMEEIDLCWRIGLSGMKVYYTGESTVYHVGGGTLGQADPFKTYLNFRNSMMTLIKNTGKRGLWWHLVIRILLDLVASIKFLLGEGFRHFAAVWRAEFYVFRKLPQILKKRRAIRRVNSRLDGLFKGSLVFSYYVLRKRFFFNLISIIPDGIVSSAQPLPEIHGKSKGEINNDGRSEGKKRGINEKNPNA